MIFFYCFYFYFVYNLIMENISELRKENIKLKIENKKLKNEVTRLSVALNREKNKNRQLQEKFDKYVSEEKERIEKIVNKAVNEVSKKYEKIIDGLNSKITKLESQLNKNSSNSGIPSSKNNINVKISNNREKSNNTKGGQKGHKKHTLEYFKDDEITETIEHTLDKCPKCNGELKEENIVISDIIDIKINIIRQRNNIHNYKCLKCNKIITANDKLPRGVTYGSNVKATALTLLNESNVAINKVSKFIKGISNNEINISEGYLSKLQKEASSKLDSFIMELKQQIIKLPIVHWDDTTCKIDNKNGIVRYYGDDYYALLIGHDTKSKDGIDEDKILCNLTKDTVCVHDHVLLNYNDEYQFKNAECNIHVLRYLKGIKDNLHDHKWQDKMSDLLKNTNEKRKELINQNILNFENEYINRINEEYDKIIKLGYEENKSTPDYHYYKKEEENLIKRLERYKENHLLFMYNFSVPFTNNTAEKGIRQVKRKMIVSYSFKNINTLKNYGRILSYIETCYRHGITKHEALKRLSENNPISIEEIKNYEEGKTSS